MKIYVKEPNGATGVIEAPNLETAFSVYPEGTVLSSDPFPVEEAAPVESEKPAPKTKKAK